MRAPEFDPALVEKAARALSANWRNMHTNEALGYQKMLARAVLTAVAPTLRAEGARQVAEAVEGSMCGDDCIDCAVAAREAVARIADGAPS